MDTFDLLRWAGGGAATVGGAALLMRFTFTKVWALVERQSATLENHVTHNTEVMVEVRDAVRELTGAVRALKSVDDARDP